jgi:GDP-4-dehydro-6-deoxy-D-mannose reductase
VRVFITGAGGFAGGHLVEHLLTLPDMRITAAVFEPPGRNPRLDGRPVEQRQLDLREAPAVHAAIADAQPELVFHLAAQAAVGQSFQDPWGTLANNIHAQVNLLEACRTIVPRARILVVSSAEVYGAAGPADAPLDERVPFAPANPYSVSKVTQDVLGLQYFLAYGLPVICARPFNHIGPGQGSGFVAADFASQIAAIEAGAREPVMFVGNLEAERDFTDVRDIVRAYALILARGEPGQAYNVCSGQAHSIQHLLDTLLSYSAIPIRVRQDPARMRPSDVPRRVGNASRLRALTGWEPQIPFEQSLLDTLNDWRARLAPHPAAGRPAGAQQP